MVARHQPCRAPSSRVARPVHSDPRNSLKSVVYNLPYILPSSVSSNPFVFTLFKKRPGCGGILLYPERKRKVYPEPHRGVYPERSEGPILVHHDATFCATPSFQQLPAIKFCNSLILITIQNARGGYRGHCFGVKVLLEVTANCTGSPGSGPASTKPGDSKSPLQRLARIGRVGAHDADAMIGKRGVHAGKLHRRHVAGDAILRGDRASFARVVLRDRRIW